MICATSVDTIRTPVVDVIGQLIRDVIGRLSVEPTMSGPGGTIWTRGNAGGQFFDR